MSERMCSRAAALVAAGLSVACSDAALTFGESSNYYFWTDHETGDFSDWTDHGQRGGFVALGGSNIEVRRGLARSGEHAVYVQGVSAEPPNWTTGMVARHRPLPEQAFYSAWFQFPALVRPAEFWILFLFRSRPDESGDSAFDNELNLLVGPDASGVPRLLIDDNRGGQLPALADNRLEAGVWFQLEVYQRIASDEGGRLSVWRDGDLLYDYRGPTARTPYVEWMLGAVVDRLQDDAHELYIDDAAISRHRLGPGVEPFSRR